MSAELDLEPTDPADQFAMLRVDAVRKGAMIARHRDPGTGTYHYTMRDAVSGEPLGRYDSVLDLEDAVMSRIDVLDER